MNVPANLSYPKDHEWVKERGDGHWVVGITDYAQDALGDITYLELPVVGTEVQEGTACGVVESVKTFSDLVAPLSGEVTEVNEDLDGNEATVNESPYEDGWLFVVKLNDDANTEGLLDGPAYEALLKEE